MRFAFVIASIAALRVSVTADCDAGVTGCASDACTAGGSQCDTSDDFHQKKAKHSCNSGVTCSDNGCTTTGATCGDAGFHQKKAKNFDCSQCDDGCTSGESQCASLHQKKAKFSCSECTGDLSCNSAGTACE